MHRNSAHHNIHTKCTMDEPIELLIDKLSTKSTDLYVFWQNYNNMYRQFNEKVNENNKLKEEVEYLKKNSVNMVNEVKNRQEDSYLKDRLKVADSNCDLLKAENEKLKAQNKELKLQIVKINEDSNNLQLLITQLREENSNQKNNIVNILQRLKSAQGELGNYSRSCEQLQEKNVILSKMAEKEKEMQMLLEEKDEEIDELVKANRDMKVKYERIIRDAINNAKDDVLSNLPPAHTQGLYGK